MTVGENIRYYRKQEGLTQKQLSELSGVHEVTIRGYETGKFIPKTENLSKLSNALNCTINDLLDIPSPEVGPLDSVRYIRIMDKIKDGQEIDTSDLDYLSDCVRKFYKGLTQDGQKQADRLIADLLANLSLLYMIPEYTADQDSSQRPSEAH